MGSFSLFHWLIIAAIVFLLFGNRLPNAMRSLGQGIAEFKKGLEGIEDLKNSAGTSARIEAWPGRPPTQEQSLHAPGDAAARS
jgi:sec-independent protein translocase protein TatA